jgi:ribosomal protein L19
LAGIGGSLSQEYTVVRHFEDRISYFEDLKVGDTIDISVKCLIYNSTKSTYFAGIILLRGNSVQEVV